MPATNPDDPPLLQVIVGSTRPIRVGEPVAHWFAGAARDHAGFGVEIVDLAAIDLPMFSEPEHPRTGRYEQDSTKAFSATIARADAFVLVVPEYNHSYNAAIKNALDHLNAEWTGKPVGMVGYGGVSGGVRAMEALYPVLIALGTVPLGATVPIPHVSRHVTGEGSERRFEPSPETEQGAAGLLDALLGWIGTLGRLGR